MTEEEHSVPQTNQRGRLVGSLSSASQDTIEKVRRIIADDQLPKKVRRDLVKQEISALVRKREVQLAGALEMEQERIADAQDVMRAQMASEKKEIVLAIENDFVTVVSTLGAQVTMAKLRCMEEFDKQLTIFCRGLERSPDHDPERKEYILKEAKEAFYTVCNMLGTIASTQLVKLEEG